MMKSFIFIAARNYRKVCYLTFLSLLSAALCFGGLAYAKTAKEIDTSVDVALERFHTQVAGAKEFAKNAKGLLVLPSVKKGGSDCRRRIR